MSATAWWRARSSAWTRATAPWPADRKSTRLNSSHGYISYAVLCLKKQRGRVAPRTEADAARPPERRRLHLVDLVQRVRQPAVTLCQGTSQVLRTAYID